MDQWESSLFHSQTAVGSGVSFETSFDSKQPKLEPKLVSALSETKRLFRLFRFYTKTENFDVSTEPKQTGDQPKQFDREHILLFLQKMQSFSGFFDFFRFFPRFLRWFFQYFSFFSVFSVVSKQFLSFVSLLYRNREFRLNRNKQKAHPNSLKESIFGNYSKIQGCFGLLRNRSVCFGCFDIGSKHRNKPKFSLFGFTKQTETNVKQILFRFVSVRTEIYFCLFRGHKLQQIKTNGETDAF